MTPKELASYFRDQVHDTKKPYLWTDTEVLRYMNLAYFEWVRLIGGLRDATSDLTQLVLPAGVATFELDRRITKILSAKITDVTASKPALRILASQDYDALSLPTRTGDVRALVFGEGESTLRVLDTPTVATNIGLVVRRLPLENVTLASEAFEVRDEQTEFIVYGMMQRAYLKDDQDTYNKGFSDRAGAQFQAEAARAKGDSERANHVPRPIQYGGY